MREVELLADSEVTLLAIGAAAGRMDCRAALTVRHGRTAVIHHDGTRETLPGKTSVRLKKGDKVRIESPGGGGWGGFF